MKRRGIIALLTAAALALTLAAPALALDTGFEDVAEGDWFAREAAYCKERGWLRGTTDTVFSPDETVSRAMAVTALHRISGAPDAGGVELPFPDVRADDWFGPAVAWAVEAGVTNGYEDGTFRPDAPVRRDELAVLIWRMWGRPEGTGAAAFADAADIPDWAEAAADWAAGTGLIRGTTDGCFEPASYADRAQFAVILARCASDPRYSSVLDRDCGASGVAAREDGTLIVTDVFYNAVWSVDRGATTRLAGDDTTEDVYGRPMGGYSDAAPLDSTFREPWGIAPFLDGWAVSDSANGAVRLLLPSAVETANCRFENGYEGFARPTGLAAGEDGCLYVADSELGVVFRMTAEGRAAAVVTGLDTPAGICYDNGTLYIAESGANRIVKWTEADGLSVAAGSGEDGDAVGAAAEAEFSFPMGVAVAEDGTIYVSDTGNSAVKSISNGAVAVVAARDRSGEDPGLFSPTGLLVRGSTLYVCDSFTRKLVAIPLI